MKKLLIILSMLVFSSPVQAVCSIDGGACGVDSSSVKTALRSNWQSPSLQEKVVPNNLENMQQTNAFQSGYTKPFHPALINNQPVDSPTPAVPNYNSNCQFGVCLPGVIPGGPVGE